MRKYIQTPMLGILTPFLKTFLGLLYLFLHV